MRQRVAAIATTVGNPSTGDTRAVVVTPDRFAWALRPREMVAYRYVLSRLLARDLTLRYRQTALGIIWVVAQPLLGAGALSFVFGRVAGLKAPGNAPYYLFALAGFVVWGVFNQILVRSSGSMVQNAAVITKVYFPRILLPVASVLGSLLDAVASIVMLVVALALYHASVGPTVLLFPIAVLGAALLASGLGLLAAALMVDYRDVGQILPVALQLALYVSPVAYPAERAPSTVRSLLDVNPLAGFLELGQWTIVGAGAPSAFSLVVSGVTTVAVLLLGLVVFSSRERRFADTI